MNQISTYWDSWALGLPFVPACWAAEVVQLRPPFASWSRASLPTLSGSCRSSQQEDDNTPTKERKEEWLNKMLFDDTPLWTFTMMIQHWAYSNIFNNHYGCDPKWENQDQDKQLTLEFAARYMSPSTFLAYATKLCIRLSSIALGSGVGKMACTLKNKKSISLTRVILYWGRGGKCVANRTGCQFIRWFDREEWWTLKRKI